MVIAFDAKRIFNNFTGLGNYSRTLVKNLSELYPDNQYHLYTPKINNKEEPAWFLNNRQFTIHTPKQRLKGLWRTFFISGELKNDKPDIYHGLSHELPVGIKTAGVKSVVTIHDLIFRQYPETYPFFDRMVYNAKFRYACQQADKVVAISKSTKTDIVHFYNIDPSRIEVIYQSCNPIYFSLQTEDNLAIVKRKYALPDDYILYVGSIEERKNLKSVLHGLAGLPVDLKLPLVVVGKGKSYKQECLQLAEKLGISGQIYWFTNLQSNSDLQAFYQAARVMVYPSLFEGFGLPVAEALLSNTPVITSGISSLPEAGGPATLYVDPKNVEEIKNSIIKVLTDSEMVRKMKAEGRRYAINNFSPEVVTRQMMDVYSNLVS